MGCRAQVLKKACLFSSILTIFLLVANNCVCFWVSVASKADLHGLCEGLKLKALDSEDLDTVPRYNSSTLFPFSFWGLLVRAEQ